MDSFVIVIIIGFFALLNYVVKKLARGAQQAKPGQKGQEFEATQDQIHEFLEQFGAAPRPPEQARPPEPPRPAEETTVSVFETGAPAVPVTSAEGRGSPEEGSPAEAAPVVVQRPRRVRARKRPAPSAPQTAAPAAALAVPDITRVAPADLKKAIIWLEILRPPIALRRRPRHRPPVEP
jgi:hypothetical protein